MNTRLHTTIAAVLLLGLPAFLHAAQASKPPASPNLIVILSDDMRYADLGAYGCQDIPTPHIDSLAKSGVRFTDAYANGAFCTPTRAALMSCRYQHRYGVEDLAGMAPARADGEAADDHNDVEHPHRVAPKEQQLTFRNGIAILPPHSLTILRIPVE